MNKTITMRFGVRMGSRSSLTLVKPVRQRRAQWWRCSLLSSSSLICGLSAVMLSGILGGCKELTGTQSLPSGVQNPSYYSTPGGALGMRNAADSLFEGALVQYIIDSGLLSDELDVAVQQSINNSGVSSAVQSSLDQRILPEISGSVGSGSYAALQQVRGATNQAIGGLAAYYPAASPALRGEMYAIQGYAEIMLADLFCSGIPLSTLDFQHDFTYKAGSRKEQVYQDAIAKFDTALAISSDSDRIMNLARVGLGRAYLALGQFTQAAQAVVSVPDSYKYQSMVQWNSGIFFNIGAGGGINNPTTDVSNGEGVNGLLFISSSDPRTKEVNSILGGNNQQFHMPAKYQSAITSPFYSPITVADGIEARLIQAEAALAAHDTGTWLSSLNQLRTSGTSPVADTIADTLGVTGCTPTVICGTDPGGSTPAFGQPPGGFHVPPGYVLTDSFNISVVPNSTLYNTCYNNSWYNPCYGNLTTTVYVYVLNSWPAGTGGVAGQALLSDPGTDSGRVSLTFRERAYWLYMTGHRQGDLRRLIRQYHRDQDTVYPTGDYFPNGQAYGNDVTVPIPSSESPNPLFHGCIDRNG